jgi:IclR family transcriptional regulator, acetate operon repressor
VDKPPPSGVQSLDRALLLLEKLADAGGSQRLAELELATGLPLPTVHRLLQSLMHNGYVRQEASRRYTLGPRLIRLGESASRALGAWARPHLAGLVSEIGETANMAVLEGDAVVYVAQVPSAHSMRMFTEVGRRVPAHCTGVGKALLSQLPSDAVRELLTRTGMPAQTPRTITDPEDFIAELAQVRRKGHAVDEGEQEVGVRCVAVPVRGALTPLGISVSGPAPRMTEELVARAVPLLHQAADRLSSETFPPGAAAAP